MGLGMWMSDGDDMYTIEVVEAWRSCFFFGILAVHGWNWTFGSLVLVDQHWVTHW